MWIDPRNGDGMAVAGDGMEYPFPLTEEKLGTEHFYQLLNYTTSQLITIFLIMY